MKRLKKNKDLLKKNSSPTRCRAVAELLRRRRPRSWPVHARFAHFCTSPQLSCADKKPCAKRSNKLLLYKVLPLQLEAAAGL